MHHLSKTEFYYETVNPKELIFILPMLKDNQNE